jgi:arylsulfatase A-like enzyme
MEKPPISLHILFQNKIPVSEDGYLTDLIGKKSLEFLDGQSKRKPFFLYIPFTAPHAPYQGPDDYLPSILPDSSDLWNQSLGPEPVYQAMITRMDQTIGKILNKLDEIGLSENTIVIFMSDNGGTKTGNNLPLRGYKGNLFEGGIRVPCLVKWPGKIPPATISEQPCITFDFTFSIARVAGTTLDVNRPPDGMDILKSVEENKNIEKRILFWRARRGMVTRKAVRHGNLKYIRLDNNGSVEEFLFNLGDDLEEKSNLLNSQPDDVNQLKALLETWENEMKPVQ